MSPLTSHVPGFLYSCICGRFRLLLLLRCLLSGLFPGLGGHPPKTRLLPLLPLYSFHLVCASCFLSLAVTTLVPFVSVIYYCVTNQTLRLQTNQQTHKPISLVILPVRPAGWVPRCVCGCLRLDFASGGWPAPAGASLSVLTARSPSSPAHCTQEPSWGLRSEGYPKALGPRCRHVTPLLLPSLLSRASP